MTADDGLLRTDRLVPSEPGIDVFVREVRPPGPPPRQHVLLVHGGGPGGLPSFDLPVPGYSLAADLARVGFAVHVLDVRGWGRSTRPAALEAPPEANPPAVRLDEAVRDIGAAVAAIRAGEGGSLALLGWASGGHWCGAYAARHAGLSHLVLLNTMYGVDAPWSLRAAFESDDRPGEFDPTIGAYALRTGAGLLRQWDRSIPGDDPTAWRDPRVAEAYVAEALASDPRSDTYDPPAIRVPTGFQLEAWAASRGRPWWEAGDVTARTLVVRGERDFWSRPEDAEALGEELAGAPEMLTVTIPGATHYLFLDRPDRGRDAFLEAVRRFLAH